MGWGKIILIIFLIIIVSIATTVVVSNWTYNMDQKYIDAGCEPITADMYGSPTTWRCPKGVEIK